MNLWKMEHYTRHNNRSLLLLRGFIFWTKNTLLDRSNFILRESRLLFMNAGHIFLEEIMKIC